MTKLSFGNVESLFNVGSPYCIEISLRTPENQTMILETWCILFNDQLVDPTQKVCFSVYKKMSLVLRSLMCITRCTPTYQLSRRQSPDSYVLLYRMYCGEPIVHHLGENYATAKVGTVGTPIGSLIVNLAYRTRLTMTTQSSSHSNDSYGTGIKMKDNHFDSRTSVNINNFNNQNSNYSDMSAPNSPISPSLKQGNTFEIVQQQQQQQQQQQLSPNSSNRYGTKTQPIPMKSNHIQEEQLLLQQQQQQQIRNNSAQLQRYQSSKQFNDESSADENNSSSVASTPDTMYYFKLKSAAFTNNHYSSLSAVNQNSENDTTPFFNLLTNDMANLNTNERQQGQQTQSPPPPSLEFNQGTGGTQPMQLKRFASKNSQLRSSGDVDDMAIASPCSLPNFNSLDNHFQKNHGNEIRAFYGPSSLSNNAAANQSEDFVFIESVNT